MRTTTHPLPTFNEYLIQEFNATFNDVLVNEETLKIKGLIPFLGLLGYTEDDLRYNTTIDVQIGTRRVNVFADVVVMINNTVQMVIDTKHPFETVTDRDIIQSASYAKLLSTPPALYGITTNGVNTFCTNVFTGQTTGLVPSKAQLLRDIDKTVRRELSDVELREVKSALITLLRPEDLFRVIRQCKEIIEKKGLIRSDSSFREMTKILLVKMAEERHALGGKKQNRFTADWLRASARANGVNEITVFRTLFEDAKTTYPEIYTHDSDGLVITDNDCIIHVVEAIEDFSFLGTGEDIKGAVYEIFLKSTLRGDLDQYFTPREFVEFMVRFADPEIGQVILDPAAGSGGFLIQAFQYVKRKIDNLNASEVERVRKFDDLIRKCLWAHEADYDLHILAKMNLIMHGDGWNNIHDGDSLTSLYLEDEFCDVVFTNPPFTIKYAFPNVLSHYELGVGKKEEELDILFVEKSIRCLREGGSLFIVLPEGMLNGASYQYFREWLFAKTHLLLSIGLPEGAFTPVGKSASKTCILGVRKKSKSDTTLHRPQRVFVGRTVEIGYECNKKEYRRHERSDLPFFIDQQQEVFDNVRQSPFGGECAWVPSETIDVSRLDASFYINRVQRDSWIKQGKQLVALGEICSVNNTVIKPASNDIYNYVEVMDISETTGTFTNMRRRFGKDIADSMHAFKGGDVLFSRINPRLPRTVLVPSKIDYGVISKEVYTLVLKDQTHIIDIAVVCAMMQTDFVRWQIARIVTGSSSSRARVADEDLLNEVYIEIPPREIQEQVSARLRNDVDALWTAAQSFLDGYSISQNLLGSNFSKDDTRRV